MSGEMPIEVGIEAIALVALVSVRDAIAKAMPKTREAVLLARAGGSPDAFDLLASIYNSLDDEICKFVAAHPDEFERASAKVQRQSTGNA